MVGDHPSLIHARSDNFMQCSQVNCMSQMAANIHALTLKWASIPFFKLLNPTIYVKHLLKLLSSSLKI